MVKRSKKKIKHRQPPKQNTEVAKESGVQQGASGKAPMDKLYKQSLIVMFLFGFLLYANTIPFEHALDDKLAITHNQFTKKGIAGISDICSNDLLVGFYGKKRNLLAGSRYRPLSLVTFAIEWSLFGPTIADKDPEKVQEKLATMAHFSHFINALLYGLTGIVLFIILSKLFPPRKNQKWYFTFPFVATVLFLAHPLHTEVVANIKSRDEIMSVLGSLAALYYTLRYLEEGNRKHIIIGGIMLFLGLAAKETSITFIAFVIPLTLYYFTKYPIRKMFMACVPLGIAAAVYLGVRYMVVGGAQLDPVPELLNDPFLHAAPNEKFATIVFTMGLYLKLLFFPHPLTHDYYPWHPISEGSFTWGNFPYLTMSDPGAIISLLLYMALLGIAIAGIKNKTMLSYGIFLYLTTYLIFSNFFFSIGTFMNERFMYIPSIGFCMIIAWLLINKLPRYLGGPALAMGLFFVITGAFAFKTFDRNTDWENDFTLATADVHASVNSAKVNMAAGLALVNSVENDPELPDKQQRLNQAIGYLNHSLTLYPNYIQSSIILASAYFQLDDYQTAFDWLKRSLKINYKFNDAKKNMIRLGNMAEEKGMNDLAIRCFMEVLNYYPDEVAVLGSIGKVYAAGLNDPRSALTYLNRAHELEPQNTDIIQKLGVTYATSGDPTNAITIFNKALEIEPDNAHIMMNIGIAYRNLGQEELAQQYLDKAFELNPALKQ